MTPGQAIRSDGSVRLAYLVTHPIQYQAPLLRRLNAEHDVDVTAFFATDFSVRPFAGADHQLILDYRGIQYVVGVSEHDNELMRWAESVNLLLTEKGKQVGAVDRSRSQSIPHVEADEGLRHGVDVS